MKLSQKELVHNGFTQAAIAYYLGGDWKTILINTRNKLIGSHRRLFDDLCTCTAEKFHQVVCRYLDGFIEERMKGI